MMVLWSMIDFRIDAFSSITQLSPITEDSETSAPSLILTKSPMITGPLMTAPGWISASLPAHMSGAIFFPGKSMPTMPPRMSRWTSQYAGRVPMSHQYPSAM